MVMSSAEMETVRVWAEAMSDEEILQSLQEIAQREHDVIDLLEDGEKKDDFLRNLAALLAAQKKYLPSNPEQTG